MASAGRARRSRSTRRFFAREGHDQRLLRRRNAAGRGPVEQWLRTTAFDRRAFRRGPADQHGHRDPPGSRTGTRSQSTGAGFRRGRRAEGRRPRGDARPSGEVRARPGVRHVAQRGGHRRPRGRHGARRTDACARNPVPQICRAGDRADPRCGHDALAHATTASPRRWCCACPAASSSAATRGTR